MQAITLRAKPVLERLKQAHEAQGTLLLAKDEVDALVTELGWLSAAATLNYGTVSRQNRVIAGLRRRLEKANAKQRVGRRSASSKRVRRPTAAR